VLQIGQTILDLSTPVDAGFSARVDMEDAPAISGEGTDYVVLVNELEPAIALTRRAQARSVP
jgi:hypothetical protein